ncbi:hypothetical protein B2J88_08555 [Rhodococcus sp. SRB_17]|nr:hypothetical protein [Rhodococcus sp. SRB_17]
MVLAFLIAAFGGLFLPSVAQAADAPVEALEYSADGINWGDQSKIVWSQDILVPGGDNTTTFHVRNATNTAGVVNFYPGDYKISPAMQLFLRVDVNGIAGTPAVITDHATAPDALLNSVHLEPNQSAKVAFVVGMPSTAGNESQNGNITDLWNVVFTPDAIDGGTGSFGSLTAGSLGSLGFGSLDFGSLNGGSSGSGSLDLGSSNYVSSSFGSINVGSADFGS